MCKLKARIFATVIAIVFAFSLSLSASANTYTNIQNVSETQTKRVPSNSYAAQRLLTNISADQIPQANDLMVAMKQANSTSVALGNVDQNIIEVIEDNISFSGVSVITSNQTKARTTANDDDNSFTINLYQFSNSEGLVSADEVLNAARSRPMTDTYSGGMNEYSVYGTLKINLRYNGTSVNQMVITDVSAMSNWGTAVIKTNKIVLEAVLVPGYGTTHDYRPNWLHSPVQQGVWYTNYPDFEGNYFNLSSIVDQMGAGADFYLSNGHTFSLGITIQFSPEEPYGHYIYYDNPWVQ